MKIKKRGIIVVLFIFIVSCSVLQKNAPDENPSEPIIANHHVVNLYNEIPDYWINEVKKMLSIIPGESHDRGYAYALEELEELNSKFAVNITWTGTPEGPTDQHLRVVRTFWTGGSWSSSAGEEDFFTNQDAIDTMKNHLSYMKSTVNNKVHAFGFGWCWDMTWHNPPDGEGVDPVYGVRWAGSSVGGPDGDMRWGIDDEDYELTENRVNLNTYINAFETYNVHESDTITFFTTGPVDSSGESGYQRYLKHEAIRDHVRNAIERKYLFDYADILCWDKNGNQSTRTWGEHTFPYIVSDYNEEWDGGQGSCHISESGCLRLGKAMWWFLARIAGWDGQPE